MKQQHAENRHLHAQSRHRHPNLHRQRSTSCGARAERDPAGGGINVARMVKRLGGDVTPIYPARGATGQLLRRLVDQEQIASLTILSWGHALNCPRVAHVL
jgi:fructose-1-phosphate kinase PfkB-like protein